MNGAPPQSYLMLRLCNSPFSPSRGHIHKTVRAHFLWIEDVAGVVDEVTAHDRLGFIEVEIAVFVPLGQDQRAIGVLKSFESHDS